MDIYRKLAEAIERKEGVSLVTIIEIASAEERHRELIGRKLLVWMNGQTESEFPLLAEVKTAVLQCVNEAFAKRKSKTYVIETREMRMECYVDVFLPPLRLIIAGAGHVAVPIVEIAKLVGFDVTVIDDRAEYAMKENFPAADEVICQPFLDFFAEAKTDKSTYVLLVTRGHKHDVMILPSLFDKEVAYIGMIGSKRRISGVFSQLKQEYPNADFDRVYAPIGLDIGAQTPEEIAVSIIGEVLKVKNEKSGISLREKIPYFIAREEEEQHE
ncbi:XdhC family protein [Alkalihalobacillus oceani]|uniref:XdhC family protein n=1 Tax=Halalkalibacter oceani TaxID=1653776 RepID=UPI00203D2E02|nr:XdhC family protein [Halalkalibacter oceani]MCM3761143.1 XdhC family protein [Halalkalibacter oceani]